MSEGVGGTPEDLLTDAHAMRLFMPGLRADFQLNETYAYRPEAPWTFQSRCSGAARIRTSMPPVSPPGRLRQRSHSHCGCSTVVTSSCIPPGKSFWVNSPVCCAASRIRLRRPSRHERFPLFPSRLAVGARPGRAPASQARGPHLARATRHGRGRRTAVREGTRPPARGDGPRAVLWISNAHTSSSPTVRCVRCWPSTQVRRPRTFD